MCLVTDEFLWLLVLVGAYFAGSFPTASIVGRLSGHDHSKEGSGNPGASNVYRTSGAAYGVATVLVDVLKGMLPVVVGLVVSGRDLASAVWIVATVGHIFPIARWRRGGKGVATAGGGALPLYPLVGVVLVAIFVAIVKLTRRASVGSLAITLLVPVGAVLRGARGFELLCAIVLAGIVVVRHKSNIGRLLSGEELTVR